MQLNLPSFDIRITRLQDREMVYDPLRGKFVALTPEEWVRQHFIHYLIEEKYYPQSRLINEHTISLFNTKKRCDTVVFAPGSIPMAIIEYKAPHVEITQRVFEQISRYNVSLHVRFLIVSNGINHYTAQINYDSNSIEFLPEIPEYDKLLEIFKSSTPT